MNEFENELSVSKKLKILQGKENPFRSIYNFLINLKFGKSEKVIYVNSETEFFTLLKNLSNNMDNISDRFWNNNSVFEFSKFRNIVQSYTRGFYPEKIIDFKVGNRVYSLIISYPSAGKRNSRYKLDLLFEDKIIFKYYYKYDGGFLFLQLLEDIFLHFDLDLDFYADKWIFSQQNNPLVYISRGAHSDVAIFYEFYHISFILKKVFNL